jgi:hypothetical protein
MEKSTRWSRAALAMALAATAAVAVGCGSQEHAATSAGSSSSQDVVAASAIIPVGETPSTGAGQALQGPEQIATVSNDSLPPDVDASIVESQVTPGTIIEVRAKGSPDVEEVLLSDGRGKPQRFVYDPTADLWRASYRVPVKITGERLELAVTAKNAIGRWRRVWVFAVVEREAAKDSTQAKVEEK